VKSEGESQGLPEKKSTGEFDLLQFFAQQLQVEKGMVQQVPENDQQVVQPLPTPVSQYDATSMAVPSQQQITGVQYIAPALPASATTAELYQEQQRLMSVPQAAVLAQTMQPCIATAYTYPGAWMGMTTACSKPAQQGSSEVDDPTERLKRKRRESAQRSRARKNAYMKQLEAENKALKDEVARLKEALCSMQPHVAAAGVAGYSCMMTS